MIRFLLFLVLIIGIFSTLRIIWGLILSNVHQLLSEPFDGSKEYTPLLSIVIPAYNEEKMIHQSVMSALKQSYHNRQVIVVNDGSTDKTLAILQDIRQEITQNGWIDEGFTTTIPQDERLVIVDQPNAGKSRAINNAVENYASGELVTVLDADSQLAPDASARMVNHFRNPHVLAMADNVRITNSHRLIELVQQVEYMLGYRLKGSEQLLRLEYIIGGVGSTFRMSALKAVGYYDTDTVTEDIDLTLKLIKHFGNRKWIFGYADDVIAYTPPVHSFPQLLKQRYRWKFGRFQALFKYRQLIASIHLQKYTLTLSWWKLPKLLVEEFFMLIDPIMLLWMIWLIMHYSDVSMLLTVSGVYFIFALTAFSTEQLRFKQRWKLIGLSPFAYFFLYVINIVDFLCLLRCLRNGKQILHRQQSQGSWQHVDR